MKRVVVTGMAGVSPVGNSWSEIQRSLREGTSGIRYMADWECYEGLNTRLAGSVTGPEWPPEFTRKKTRTMGRLARLSVLVTKWALEQAGLLGDKALTDGRTGVAYGSSSGSTDAVMDFVGMRTNMSTSGINSTTYLRMMPHTAAVNIAVYFELKGRVVPTCSACTSGSQGIGYAYEAIALGKQAVMVAGGGEELCPTEAAVFDTLYATSVRNDEPTRTPRPYDTDRDGLVVGEGATTLILEELEHAKARGAPILAEVVGYRTNCDGAHVTQPNAATMQIVMESALEDAGISPDAVGYVNGHGTATDRGDIAETQATHKVFGPNKPLSSLKGHTGHTMGACGALEAWLALEMLNFDWYAPTLNLESVDERCGELDYIMGDGRSMSQEYIMSNNFAFGGINTSLVFRRWA